MNFIIIIIIRLQLLPNHTSLELDMELELQQNSNSSNEGVTRPVRQFLGAQTLRLAGDACMENEVVFTPRREARRRIKSNKKSDRNLNIWNNNQIDIQLNGLEVNHQYEDTFTDSNEASRRTDLYTSRRKRTYSQNNDIKSNNNNTHILSHSNVNYSKPSDLNLYDDSNQPCETNDFETYNEVKPISTTKSMTSSIDSAIVDMSPSMSSSYEFFDNISPKDEYMKFKYLEPNANFDEVDEILLDTLITDARKRTNYSDDTMIMSNDSALYSAPNSRSVSPPEPSSMNHLLISRR